MGTQTLAPTLAISRTQAVRLLRRDPIALIERAAELGDIVRIPVPRYNLALANRPDLAWNVLSSGDRDFHKSPTLRNAKRVLGEGLLTSEGSIHRRQRRLIQPIFHHERIAGYGAAMVEAAERTATELPSETTIDMHAAMGRLTLDIAARTLFGSDLTDAEMERISGAMTEVLSQFDRQFTPWFQLTARLPIPSTRRFYKSVHVFDDVVQSLIERRRAEGAGGDDLLSLLLAASENGETMDDTQVRDEAVTLLLAGHETTANAMTWTWWLLSQHPEAQEMLKAELREVLPVGPPSANDLPNLPVTRAVISESIRLRPPAWLVGRQAVNKHDLGGHQLDPGDVVVVSPWLLHHDERWWSEPDEFRPQRWLGDGPAAPRHAYLPFGGGTRMCIGEGFAWMETCLVLATIARHRRFALDPSARVALQPVITLRPRYGMPMRTA